MILSHCKENGKMLSVYDISLQKNRIQTLQSPAKHRSAKTKWRGWVQKLRRVGENCHSSCLDSKIFLPTIDGPPEAFFSRLQNRGGQNLAGCGHFSSVCSFYCTACSFYFTADARSDSENLQKFLKKWLFWTYLVPII